ncbi:MAG: hypothetical protein NWQ37_09685, partial [Marivita lacus]|nr:hypothetical protein [Marivita lacus]
MEDSPARGKTHKTPQAPGLFGAGHRGQTLHSGPVTHENDTPQGSVMIDSPSTDLRDGEIAVDQTRPAEATV